MPTHRLSRRRRRRLSAPSASIVPVTFGQGSTEQARADAIEARRLASYVVRAATEFLRLGRRSDGGFGLLLLLALVRVHDLAGAPIDLEPDALENMPPAERTPLLRELTASAVNLGRAGRTGFDKRIDWLSELVGLTEPERAVFGLIARLAVRYEYQCLKGLLDPDDRGMERTEPATVALLTGMTAARARRVLEPRGRLVQLGLVTERDSFEPELADTIKAFLDKSVASPATMRAALLPVAPSSGLALSDYDHLSHEVADARALIEHARRTGCGCNILFHGVPGTGKTELARLLADVTGLPAIEVGIADDEGDEPTRRERLLHLRLCRNLCGAAHPAVLVVDEAEDLFRVPRLTENSSKVWINRLVEERLGIHIWIVNDVASLGEPLVRRMDLAIGFTQPSTPQLTRLAERTTTRARRRPSASTIAALAAMRASPAIIATATRTAGRIGWDEDRLLRISGDLNEAAGRTQAGRPFLAGERFDPALSRANHDLEHLAGRLAASTQSWSLLMSGPPGTGKTAFAHHLASESGCDLIMRSAGDLLGCFVGETEAAIGAAFREARRTNSILLIDEADSFLSDRSRARQQWEASMVNEMLRQMEVSGARFIATTNRADVLDPASARRFTLAVQFSAMTPEQAAAMFESRFGLRCPPALRRMEGLTPGDFAQASSRAGLLGGAEPAELLRWLEEALAGRGHAQPIGF